MVAETASRSREFLGATGVDCRNSRSRLRRCGEVKKKLTRLSEQLHGEIDIALDVIIERAPGDELEDFIRRVMTMAGKYGE